MDWELLQSIRITSFEFGIASESLVRVLLRAPAHQVGVIIPHFLHRVKWQFGENQEKQKSPLNER
jgi:hypothetical protein